jgi:ABC-type transporter Mla subunit MlaD
MADPTTYEDLKRVLQEFKDFLGPKVAEIGDVIRALTALFPDLNKVIDQLISLMDSLRAEIQRLDAGTIGDDRLAQFTDFAAKTRNLLVAAKPLLNSQAGTIDTLLSTLDVVVELPSLDDIKGTILGLIDEIRGLLESLKRP